MVLHKHKLIFIHIPKCAGSSVEEFFGIAPFDWRAPNYDHMVGWCPVRSIHMQHATLKQLRDFTLVSEEILNSFYKFAIVRNPVDRAISDYFWVMRDRKVKDSFSNFMNQSGAFKEVLRNYRVPTYRGDHLRPQTEYVEVGQKIFTDVILKFERLHEDWREFLVSRGWKHQELPHAKNVSNDTKKKILSSRIFNEIKRRYISDFDTFGYSTDYVDYKY